MKLLTHYLSEGLLDIDDTMETPEMYEINADNYKESIWYNEKNVSGKNMVIGKTNTIRLISSRESIFPKAVNVDLTGVEIKYDDGLFCLFNNSNKLKHFKLDSLKNSPDKLSLSYMFNNCSSLENVVFSGDPLYIKALNTRNMFRGCSKLKELDLSSLDFSMCSDTYDMFDMCSNLRSIDFGLSVWKDKTCDTERMFNGCKELRELDLTNVFSGKKIMLADALRLFNGCENLRSIRGVLTFDFLNIDRSLTFGRCDKLEDVRIRIIPPRNPKVVNPTIHIQNILPRISEESLKFFVENIGNVKNNSKYIGAKITVSSKEQMSRMSPGFGDWMRDELSSKGWNLEIK